MTKRIRITQVIVPFEHDVDHVIRKACRISGIDPEKVRDFEIMRRSLDARKKDDLKYVYTVDLIADPAAACSGRDPRVEEVTPVCFEPVVTGVEEPEAPIAVIGTGPAGLFCAFLLAEHGFCPLIFERGKRVEERTEDVDRFWNGGKLDPDSNVQFGEGGAGTFSDGKLNTAVRDRQGRNRFVLETFVRFGAPEDILYDSQPHIGTDVLRTVVSNMRNEIIRMGGKFFFSSGIREVEIENRCLKALCTVGGDRVETSAAVFAIGHSARDTFAMLHEKGIAMTPKPFAVGMRIEHPQDMIDRCRYGEGAGSKLLPPASYKLTHLASNGRSVYSFCMCPGGYVINASSEDGRIAVNGMSYRDRGTKNANSAIIVSVTPDDFPNPDDPLSGIAFQRELEERAFRAGNGRIPQQKFGDFEKDGDGDVSGSSDGTADLSGLAGDDHDFASCTRGACVPADLRQIFPDAVREAFVEGIHAFSGQIQNFDREDAILSAVESRTSSPVRITRDPSCVSSIAGIYPCGEGAGYAGGIMSAAMDGLKVAEALMARYAPGERMSRNGKREVFS